MNDTESHVLELKLKSMILDSIHAIDVVEQLEEVGCRSLDDWVWQKQLRYFIALYLTLRVNHSVFPCCTVLV